MRDLKKRTGASLGVMAAVALIAVGAPASAENLRVMFQGDPYEIDAVSAVAKKFEAANPGTTVELIHTPHDSYNEKVGAAVSANQLPDILQLDAPFLSNYVWSGFLQPIDGLIDKSLLDDMTPSNISQGTYPPDAPDMIAGPAHEALAAQAGSCNCWMVRPMVDLPEPLSPTVPVPPRAVPARAGERTRRAG